MPKVFRFYLWCLPLQINFFFVYLKKKIFIFENNKFIYRINDNRKLEMRDCFFDRNYNIGIDCPICNLFFVMFCKIKIECNKKRNSFLHSLFLSLFSLFVSHCFSLSVCVEEGHVFIKFTSWSIVFFFFFLLLHCLLLIFWKWKSIN